MDPTTDEQLPPPPQPPQPHRSSTSCDRHSDEQFTGFCPSCLCERLAVLDQSAGASTAGAGARKSASSALKSLFKPSNDGGRPSSSSTSFLPELRRTKSFSGRNNDGFSGAFEPQRKSCDVRGRSTLFSLFSQHDHEKRSGSNPNPNPSNSYAINLGVYDPIVTNSKQNDAVEHLVVEEEEEEEFHDSNVNGEDEDEIQEVREEIVAAISGENVQEIVEEEEEERTRVLKTMKDHIDLDSQNKIKMGSKDLKELAGSFWTAASVFSKKLKAWRTKKNNHNHKMKKHNGMMMMSGKKNTRDTQSEIADYGYGRRSCDTDPRLSFDVGRFSVDAGRFSVDAGRVSFDNDNPRCSFDEPPRASWDGGYYSSMNGRTAFPRMVIQPPMVSVVEDPNPKPPLVVVSRKDAQIPVEEPRRSSVSINGEDCGFVPGGATQTKDYYSDSSSKRRKSLDRSSSIRKTAASVVADMDELKISSSNNNGDRGDLMRDLRDLNSSYNSRSLRDDCCESFDMGFRDNASVIGSNGGGGERKGSNKKSRRWRAWNIWGLLYNRRGNAKDEDDDRYSSRANGVERSFSESWQDLRRSGSYLDPKGGFNRNGVFRSNSSVSWRNSYNLGSINNNGVHGSRKKREEFVLERNRSARYSPSHTNASDNGMLRLYLTPMRGSRRGGSGKPKPAYSHSFARSVLRLY